MTWHPLLLAVIALHVVGLALVGAAAIKALQLVAGWDPASASAKQLALERAAEGASVQASAAFAAFGAGSVVLVGAIATALPTLVPGAMCGTGVLEAMQGLGGRALVLQGIALALFVVWRELDRLDRSRPDAPLATAAGRALLVTLPAQVVASWATLQAVLSLDTHRAVDCCSAVYAGVQRTGVSAALAGPGLVWLAAIGALAVVVLALVMRAGPGRRGRVLGLALVSGVWVVVAAYALVRVLAAYRYEVLSHECPWCLFLGEHGFAGYGLFGALALVALEAVACVAASRAAEEAPATADVAALRIRSAGGRIVFAVVVFVVLAGWPAVSWYARFGVWMHTEAVGSVAVASPDSLRVANGEAPPRALKFSPSAANEALEPQRLAALEAKVGPLPDDLRDLLVRYNGGFFGLSDTGLSDGRGSPVYVADLVGLHGFGWTSLSDDRPELPPGFLLIATRGIAHHFVLQLRDDEHAKRGEVWFFDDTSLEEVPGQYSYFWKFRRPYAPSVTEFLAKLRPLAEKAAPR